MELNQPYVLRFVQNYKYPSNVIVRHMIVLLFNNSYDNNVILFMLMLMFVGAIQTHLYYIVWHNVIMS